jgi:ribonuclease D
LIINFLKNKLLPCPKIITQQKDFLAICQQIKEGSAIAVDTEFMREKTYYPLLCLVQINIAGKSYAIDALSADIDLRPFFTILENEKIKKIFHSSYQDMEVLIQINKTMPRAVVDTQIMANVCGFDYNISYAKLAKNLLDKNLDKDWQRSDWQKRPLHKEQVRYALIDVDHLPKIYQILEKKLAENSKFQWFEEEMNSFLNKNYDIDNQDLFKKFSMVNKNQTSQDNLKLLIPWRDIIAKKRNVPRSYILKDDILSKICTLNPTNMDEMNECCRTNKYMGSKIKKEILALLQNKAPIIEEIELEPQLKISYRLTDEQDAFYQKTRVLLQKKAKEFNLKAEFIINQNDLRQLIMGHKKVPEVLNGWRFQVIGDDLQEIISSIPSKN